jgi:ankyrin repeat protein
MISALADPGRLTPTPTITIERNTTMNKQHSDMHETIVKAFKSKDIEPIKQWLEIDPARIDGFEKYILMWIDFLESCDKLELLEADDILLHLAAQWSPNVDAVKRLIEQDGYKFDNRGYNGDTPLHCSACNPNIEILKYLVEQGADANAKSGTGDTPLHHAARYSNVEALKCLVEQGGADVKAKSNGGFVPLHFVNSVNISKYLVEQGADVNAKDEYGRTPLHFADWCNGDEAVEIAKFLIEQGADIHAADNCGRTPLHLAVYGDWAVEFAKFLIEHGADVNVKDKEGETPLHSAVWDNPNVEVMKLLVEHGADIYAESNDRYTPLDVARSHAKSEEVWLYFLGLGFFKTHGRDVVIAEPDEDF